MLLLFFFVREMDQSILDSSVFLMTNIFCNVCCKIYFFEMNEVR